MTRARTFILSPARLDGERARRLLQPGGSSPLAAALRDQGAPIGEVFRFVSSLYFRGKLAYAERFGRGSWVMTANSGLRPVDSVVRLEDLEMFAMTDIGEEEPRFRAPLTRDARALAERIGPQGEVVLLGSIASMKYVEPLLEVFDQQLLFPPAFVGRGNMSRGGLLLRAVEAGEELEYAPLRGAIRHGGRAPKLPPRPKKPS